jgi:hypothetical protein
MDARQVATTDYLFDCNNPALSFNFILDNNYFTSARESYFANYINPISIYLALHPQAVMFHIAHLDNAFDNLNQYQDLKSFDKIIETADRLLEAQKIVLKLIDHPERSSKILDPNGKYKKRIEWLDVEKIAALSQSDLSAYKIVNREIYRLLKNWVRVCTPYHAEFTEELDEENLKARAFLQEQGLASFKQLAKLAATFPKAYNKDYFIFESLNILRKPAPQAVVDFKRFLLNWELSRLGVLHFLNYIGRSMLRSRVEFNEDSRLVKELVTLRLIHTDVMVDYDYNVSMFIQRRLLHLTVDANYIVNVVREIQRLAPNPVDEHQQMINLAKQFSSVRDVTARMIINLNKYSDSTNWSEVSRLNYTKDSICSTLNFINPNEINQALQHRVAENAVDELITISHDLIKVIAAVVAREKVPDELLNKFSLCFKENSYQVGSNAEQAFGLMKVIRINKFCDLLNDLYASAVSAQTLSLVKNKLKNLLYTQEYCGKMATLNDQHQATLLKLNEKIYGCVKQEVTAKKKPKKTEAASSVLSEQEQAEIDAENFQRMYEKVTKAINVFEEYRDKAKAKLSGLPQDGKMLPVRGLFEGLIESINSMFNGLTEDGKMRPVTVLLKGLIESLNTTFEPPILQYTKENSIHLSHISDVLNDINVKLQKLVNEIVLHEYDLRKSFLEVLKRVKAVDKNFTESLAQAKIKLKKLTDHAIYAQTNIKKPAKGFTDKAIYPDFELAVNELTAARQLLSAADKLKEYTPDNMNVINQALENFAAMEMRLQRLHANLDTAAIYFKVSVVPNSVFMDASSSSNKGRDANSRAPAVRARRS